MTRAGLLVVNPPYGFTEQMQRAAVLLAPRLGGLAGGAPADIRVTWRAGSQ